MATVFDDPSSKSRSPMRDPLKKTPSASVSDPDWTAPLPPFPA
jgi:hypothetical protein